MFVLAFVCHIVNYRVIANEQTIVRKFHLISVHIYRVLSFTQTMSVGEDMPLVVITKKNATQTAIPGDFHRCQTLTTP